MIGTVLAGFAALAALAVSTLALTIQTADRDERLAQQRAAFAAKVTWWFESEPKEVLVIQNTSTEPMIVEWRRGAAPGRGHEDWVPLGAQPPCTTSRYGRILVAPEWANELFDPVYGNYALRITDPQGQHWDRLPRGELIFADPLNAGGPYKDAREVESGLPLSRDPAPGC